MRYRFYFNFPTINELTREAFFIHFSSCSCRNGENSHNGFWTDWYDQYQDAHDHFTKLLHHMRHHDFEVRPCGECEDGGEE